MTAFSAFLMSKDHYWRIVCLSVCSFVRSLCKAVIAWVAAAFLASSDFFPCRIDDGPIPSVFARGPEL